MLENRKVCRQQVKKALQRKAYADNQSTQAFFKPESRTKAGNPLADYLEQHSSSLQKKHCSKLPLHGGRFQSSTTTERMICHKSTNPLRRAECPISEKLLETGHL